MAARRIGVVGLGVIGRHYVDAIGALPGVELAAVCDRRPETLAGQRVPVFTEHLAMLADGGLDAVVVTAPNDVHAAVCADALATGVSVCVEKPLALSAAEGRDLVGLAEEVGRTLFTAFHRRYNDNLAALRVGLSSAPPVISVTVRYLERIEEHVGPDAWYLDPARCGGGCVADNGPNAFDIVRVVLGDHVGLTVRDMMIIRDDHGVDRQAVIGLDADSGARATVELDWSYPGETKDVLVRFAGGAEQRIDLLAGFPGFKGSLRHEYLGVLRAFLAQLATPQGADGGLAALSLVEAAYRAERTAVPAAEGAWR
jgi:predicted dehydrogenase